MNISFDVNAGGPLFDGIAEEEVHRYASHLEEFLGDTAVAMIRAYLPTQYMYLGHYGGTPETNPVPADAGHLAAMVHKERTTTDSVLVTSDPVTYGPWIEGTSTLNLITWPHRRNPPARRFPGYHTFRIISGVLDGMADEISETLLIPYLDAMND